MWTDIAVNFSDYDQKLIFEGFNELNNGNYDSDPTKTELSNVNILNNAFVTAVRNAGGKNTDRVLIVAGYNTNIDYTVSDFAKPNDTASDRLMLSVHYYEPSDFALNENGTDEWDEDIETIEAQFKKISDFAKTKNMPVFIGEYGAIDKNNDESRAAYLSSLNEIANSFANIVTAYWDNGYTGQYGFALFDRSNNTVTDTGETLLEYIIG